MWRLEGAAKMPSLEMSLGKWILPSPRVPWDFSFLLVIVVEIVQTLHNGPMSSRTWQNFRFFSKQLQNISIIYIQVKINLGQKHLRLSQTKTFHFYKLLVFVQSWTIVQCSWLCLSNQYFVPTPPTLPLANEMQLWVVWPFVLPRPSNIGPIITINLLLRLLDKRKF